MSDDKVEDDRAGEHRASDHRASEGRVHSARRSGLSWLVALLMVVAVVLLFPALVTTPEAPLLESDGRLGEVTLGELIVRNAYQGHLDSRHVVAVAAKSQGSSNIVWIAEEGAKVMPGAALVEFDTAEIEAEGANIEAGIVSLDYPAGRV